MQKSTENKFVGPDHSAAIWYAASQNQRDKLRDNGNSSVEGASTNPDPIAIKTKGNLAVDIWLFGLLSTMTEERPLKICMANDATPMDVLTELEERFGSEILSHIKDPVIGILPSCRIFVDGETFEDVSAPIAANRDAASIEMILLKGFEGG